MFNSLAEDIMKLFLIGALCIGGLLGFIGGLIVGGVFL